MREGEAFHNARIALAGESRLARNAGSTPPASPITAANAIPSTISFGVIVN